VNIRASILINLTFLDGPTVVLGLGGALRLERKRRRGGDADSDLARVRTIGEIDRCADLVAEAKEPSQK
jgi:hypothetical protein